MLRIFLKNKTIYLQRKKLFFVIEKLTNIALTKISMGDNQSLSNIIDELKGVLIKFFKLRKNNPDKYTAFLCSWDFYENNARLWAQKYKLSTKSDDEWINYKKLKEQERLSILFEPRKVLQGLSLFLRSFERIWNKALFCKNEEISSYVYYLLKSTLEKFVIEPDNDIFIEQFLQVIRAVVWGVIRDTKNDKQIDDIIYAATVSWYMDIVFDKTVDKFDRRYLKLFDKYFLSIVTKIISENRKILFKNIVKYTIDGNMSFVLQLDNIFDYIQILQKSDIEVFNEINSKHNLWNKCQQLKNMSNFICSVNQLNDWLRVFDELKNIIEPHLDESDKDIAIDYEKKMKKSIEDKYKIHNLMVIYFKIGSFCLFKKRYKFIRYFWDYNQPHDADAYWIGNDIVPGDLTIVVSLYFNLNNFENEFFIWEDHHGGNVYKEKYFLLLIAKILDKFSIDQTGKCNDIDKFGYPNFDAQKSREIEYAIEHLSQVVDDLVKERELLSKFGLMNIDDSLRKKLITFLEKLKICAQAKISKLHKVVELSHIKINEFKSDVLSEFQQSRNLKNILYYLDCYVDKSNDIPKYNIERLGINQLDDRAIFFKDWYISFSKVGKDYGRNLAYGEDSIFYNKIAQLCKESTLNEFSELDDLIFKIGDKINLIIITDRVCVWKHFEKSKSYIPKWDKNARPIDISEFQGSYTIHDVSIPIFTLSNTGLHEEILILNRNKLGKMIQYSPLNENDAQECKSGMLYIGIEDLAVHEEIVNKIYQDPPEWLKQKGDEETQQEYLKDKAIIKVYERLIFEKAMDFIGYRIKLDSESL